MPPPGWAARGSAKRSQLSSRRHLHKGGIEAEANAVRLSFDRTVGEAYRHVVGGRVLRSEQSVQRAELPHQFHGFLKLRRSGHLRGRLRGVEHVGGRKLLPIRG